MAEFNGIFEHTIDAKGRMFIPADFREELGSDFLVFRYREEDCLFIMTRTDHGNLAAAMTASMKKSKLSSKEAATEQRIFRANSYKADMDVQNRMLIPMELRKLVGLENEKAVTVVGVGNRVELWNSEKWHRATQGGSCVTGEAAEDLNALIL